MNVYILIPALTRHFEFTWYTEVIWALNVFSRTGAYAPVQYPPGATEIIHVHPYPHLLRPHGREISTFVAEMLISHNVFQGLPPIYIFTGNKPQSHPHPRILPCIGHHRSSMPAIMEPRWTPHGKYAPLYMHSSRFPPEFPSRRPIFDSMGPWAPKTVNGWIEMSLVMEKIVDDIRAYFRGGSIGVP